MNTFKEALKKANNDKDILDSDFFEFLQHFQIITYDFYKDERWSLFYAPLYNKTIFAY